VEIAPYIALAVLTVVVAVGNRFWPSRRRRIVRALASRPRALVHGAEGTVRLTGRVRRNGGLLSSPLSGRPCVAYEFSVHEPIRFSGNDGGNGWHCLVDMREATPFLVADESGEARIDPSGPFLMSLKYDRGGESSGKHPGKHQDLASVLAAIDIASTGWLGGWRRFRYAEGVLEEGELVSVSAASVLEVDQAGERAGPRSPPQRLVLRGTEEQPLLISDEKDATGD
jgi:hypothetical protein